MPPCTTRLPENLVGQPNRHIRSRHPADAVNITVDCRYGLIGDVELSTSNARVHTECTCGRIVARSSNGKIELSEHKGSVDAATSNGTIRCRLASVDAAGVVLATSNGRITLELPADCDGDVDIRVDNGTIRTQREMSCAPREKEGRLRCTLGRGGAPIRVRASNGSVSLR